MATEARDIEPSKLKSDEELFTCLRDEIWADIQHSNAWRVNAKEEFAFVAGPGQWKQEDLTKLRDEQRPPVTFNETLKFVRAVSGLEVNNRQTTTFLPTDLTAEGEVLANEMLSAGSEWMDQGCYATRKKSRSFRDLLICGMGWGESLMEFDDDPKGKYMLDRVNPLEMVWDRDARDQNVADAKRIARVRKMSLEAARRLVPGVTDDESLTADDLDASWAADVSAPKADGVKSKEQKELRQENMAQDGHRREVHIVQVQWWEHETYYKIPNPQAAFAAAQGQPAGDTTMDVSEAEFKALKKRAGKGKDIPHAKLRRKVFKQAFLGGKLLGEVKNAPRPNGFTFHCMTGEPDDNEGVWFGLVRLARDPQAWQNKFFSVLMDMINKTAKGGVLAEDDVTDDVHAFKASYAKPQAVTFVKSGAISKQKIMAKPGQAVTGGILQLFQMANEALPRVLGINLELMGMADRDQPGILEAQRKQAAMTILATLFDSLAMWEQERGRTKLHFLQTIVPDGVFLRIQGEQGYRAIKFIRDQALGKYDVIVDDAPTSTNMKEKAWQGLQLLLPTIQPMLTPKVAAVLLDYVPFLPTKLIETLKKIATAPDPGAQKQQQLAEDAQVAQTAKDKASAILDMAKAASEQIKAQTMQLDAAVRAYLGLTQPAQPVADDEAVIGPTGGSEPAELPELGQSMPSVDPMTEAMPSGLGVPALPGGLVNGAA